MASNSANTFVVSATCCLVENPCFNSLEVKKAPRISSSCSSRDFVNSGLGLCEGVPTVEGRLDWFVAEGINGLVVEEGAEEGLRAEFRGLLLLVALSSELKGEAFMDGTDTALFEVTFFLVALEKALLVGSS